MQVVNYNVLMSSVPNEYDDELTSCFYSITSNLRLWLLFFIPAFILKCYDVSSIKLYENLTAYFDYFD